MFCIKCGMDLPDDSQFCRKCGHPQAVPASTAQSTGIAAGVAPATPVAPAVVPNRSRSAVGYLALALALGFLGVVLWMSGPFGSHTGTANSEDDPARQIARQPVIRHMTTTVFNAPFVIQPGRYTYYKLTVPERSSNVKLNGHFLASGGSGNDVEVFVLDDDGFVNLQNHHQTTPLYSSGRVTQGTVEVSLPSEPKTYYFIVSNAFSTVSNKALSGEVKLTYDHSL